MPFCISLHVKLLHGPVCLLKNSSHITQVCYIVSLLICNFVLVSVCFVTMLFIRVLLASNLFSVVCYFPYLINILFYILLIVYQIFGWSHYLIDTMIRLGVLNMFWAGKRLGFYDFLCECTRSPSARSRSVSIETKCRCGRLDNKIQNNLFQGEDKRFVFSCMNCRSLTSRVNYTQHYHIQTEKR